MSALSAKAQPAPISGAAPSAVDNLVLARIAIHTDDVVAHFRETCSGNQSNVTRSNDC